MTKKRVPVTVTVIPDLSPRIESWLDGRGIEYEVETLRLGRGAVRLKILAFFPSDENGAHQTEMYKRFLNRVKNK